MDLASISPNDTSLLSKNRKISLADFDESLRIQYMTDLQNPTYYRMIWFAPDGLRYSISQDGYWSSELLSGHFLQPARLTLNDGSNIGFSEMLKNSSPTNDNGTVIINYHDDGSNEQLQIKDDGIYAHKVNSNGQAEASKIIVQF